jgi:hypothetical protein
VRWEELVSGPAATLAGGIGGALVAQATYWVRVRRSARAREAAEAAGNEPPRLDNEETANERLVRNINHRLQLCEQRYRESERQKHELAKLYRRWRNVSEDMNSRDLGPSDREKAAKGREIRVIEFGKALLGIVVWLLTITALGAAGTDNIFTRVSRLEDSYEELKSHGSDALLRDEPKIADLERRVVALEAGSNVSDVARRVSDLEKALREQGTRFDQGQHEQDLRLAGIDAKLAELLAKLGTSSGH